MNVQIVELVEEAKGQASSSVELITIYLQFPEFPSSSGAKDDRGERRKVEKSKRKKDNDREPWLARVSQCPLTADGCWRTGRPRYTSACLSARYYTG